MVILLLGFLVAHGKTEENTEISHASVSNSDFIMGEFEAVRKDDGCVKMKIIVYEIEGAQGSYYALIGSEKYKVRLVGEGIGRCRVYDCEGRRDYNGLTKYDLYSFCIVYKGATYVFNMPIDIRL